MSAQVVFLLLCLSLFSVQSDMTQSETHLEHLTDSTFSERTATGKWILSFYAPWCPHCKKLKPQLESAGILLQEKNIALNLGMIDCTVETATCASYRIRGYPTLKYMVDARIGDYSAGREAEDFVQFGERVTSEPVSLVDDVDGFVDREGVNFVFFGSDDQFEVFEKMASLYQHLSINFGRVPVSELSKFSQDLKSPAIILFNDNPNKVNGEPYTGEFVAESIDSWIGENKMPILNSISEYTWGAITKSGKLTVLAVSDPSDSEFLNTVRSVGSSNNKYTFAFMDAVKYEQFLSNFGVNKDKIPAVIIYDGLSSIHYSQNPFPSTTIEGINSFIQAVESGEIDAEGPGVGYQAAATRFLVSMAEYLEDNIYLTIALIIFLCLTIVLLCFSMLQNPGEDKEKKE